jgi:hypothetical protein
MDGKGWVVSALSLWTGLPLALAVLVAGSTIGAPPSESSSQRAVSSQEGGAAELPPAGAISGLEERNAELLGKHTEVWDLMGLSPKAKAELNRLVVSINTGIHKNRNEQPEALEKAIAIGRSDNPLSYEGFVSGHKRRFDLLKISGPTQAELLAALDFTWKALHDPEIPEQKREVAEKIRDMMKSMGGPPPCCDDRIFNRAGMAR